MGGLSIDIEGTHTYFTDLAVSLEGPDGTSYSIQRRGRANPFRTHTVRRARGHASAGEWVLSIADQVGQDSGALRGFSMTITCQ
jgi:subtilisin-like proprotein convertase family protein